MVKQAIDLMFDALEAGGFGGKDGYHVVTIWFQNVGQRPLDGARFSSRGLGVIWFEKGCHPRRKIGLPYLGYASHINIRAKKNGKLYSFSPGSCQKDFSIESILKMNGKSAFTREVKP